MRPWRQPGGVGLRSPGDSFADRGRLTVSRSGIFFLPAQVGLCRIRIRISFSRFAFSAGPFVRGSWPKNRKVGNESLPARSDCSNGEVILRFYFPGFWSVFGLRGFSGLFPRGWLPPYSGKMCEESKVASFDRDSAEESELASFDINSAETSKVASLTGTPWSYPKWLLLTGTPWINPKGILLTETP